ncbi:MAG: chemotaxis protein CheW [Treponema sp.]|jgi:purine-binding chemotaxis protein CheW|nr:chemotaxis protein CheW [Treponema sp.]MBQ4235757.1 chemotaxis protein CheW [Treponema sp.]MBQ5385181.1 chemotaxis protein CheW [Treponema sp.]
MATIQDKLNILASTTQVAEDGTVLTQDELEEEKRKSSVIDYKMVTFSLAGKDYAIDIMKVKEIAKAGHFTYVPNTLPFVLGVHNLRGEIISIIDLRKFFNIQVPDRADDAMENMLIVTVGEQTFGVVVDGIDKVVGIQKSTIQPPHPLFGDINIKYISGVVEAQKRLYILLDIDKIFGVKSPEEEKQMAETAKNQIMQRQAVAAELAAERAEHREAPVSQEESEEVAHKTEEVDLNFISDSLQSLKKFTISPVTEEWAKKRYIEWKKERGADKTQLEGEADAEAFLKPFYSRCNQTWWSDDYAKEVAKVLPENNARNIVVWNPGCGKGYESYSLACILKKRYPSARIRVYAHDIDLLSVSNAPLMVVGEQASMGWYRPYLTKNVSGEYVFTQEIKDMIMFEYHDCVNTNSLPPIDIVFARDIISFLPEASQRTIIDDFEEKVKGNGLIIVGDNENISLPGWSKKTVGSIGVYSK